MTRIRLAAILATLATGVAATIGVGANAVTRTPASVVTPDPEVWHTPAPPAEDDWTPGDCERYGDMECTWRRLPVPGQSEVTRPL